LSPRDDMFAADVFDQNVTFVFEPFHFPRNARVGNENDMVHQKKQKDTTIPKVPLQMKRTVTANNHASGWNHDLKSFEIEPRALNGDETSPKRRLPLPWLS
jgi:hypothetical protein